MACRIATVSSLSSLASARSSCSCCSSERMQLARSCSRLDERYSIQRLNAFSSCRNAIRAPAFAKRCRRPFASLTVCSHAKKPAPSNRCARRNAHRDSKRRTRGPSRYSRSHCDTAPAQQYGCCGDKGRAPNEGSSEAQRPYRRARGVLVARQACSPPQLVGASHAPPRPTS